MKTAYLFTIGFIILTFQCYTQTDTRKIKESKINITNYLNLTCAMLSESTGYLIKYDTNGNGHPVDLKYSSQERLKYLEKASEYYFKVTSCYEIILASLTEEQKHEFQFIDKSILKIINEPGYKNYISKPTLSLPAKEIFPTITFIEIVKVNVDKLSNSIMNTLDNTNKTNKGDIVQTNFMREKTELFKRLINSGKSTSEIKYEQSKLTQSFLTENNDIITNWEGEIIWIDMFKEKDLDIAISIKPRKIVGQKTITDNGRYYTFDCGITIEARQIPSKQYGYKGIARSGELYKKVKNLQEGDKVIFSAKVVEVKDDTEETGLNLLTSFEIQLTDIKKK